VLDTVARLFTPPCAGAENTGKLRKDNQSCKSVKDYLQGKYVCNLIDKRKGRYEPTQIVRSFWRSYQ